MSETFTKARTKLILKHPFFGTLCMKLLPVQKQDMPTGATDGKHLFYNPEWFDSLKPDERVGFLAHEVMHIVFMHMTRRGQRTAERWNIAADHVINILLHEEGILLPDGGYRDTQYAGMTTEQVYDLLPEPPQGWDSIELDSGGHGGVLDHPDLDGSKESQANIEIKNTININQAAEVAKNSGKLPASLKGIIEDINKPKVNWKHVLARFLRANNKSDFSWTRPNRRFIASGLYLPSLHTPSLEQIVVAVDTSASISEDELIQFVTETSTILQDLNPELVHFLQCDTEVKSHDKYTREDLPLKVEYIGRGGTDFKPVIDFVNENIPNASALVYLTDLECSSFGKKPNYPVLWVSTSMEEADYGEIIKM